MTKNILKKRVKYSQKRYNWSMTAHKNMIYMKDTIFSSVHLFLMFPEKEPGRLTAFRSGIVQTENLSDLAKVRLLSFLLEGICK